MASALEFSQVHQRVIAYKEERLCATLSQSLAHLVLESLFGIDEDSCSESITDGPQDRGVDAVYFQQTRESTHCHILQFKYVDSFSGTNKNFPGGEVDKLSTFVDDVFNQRDSLKKTSNPLIWEKVQRIWDAFRSPRFEATIWLVGNLNYIRDQDYSRLSEAISKRKVISVKRLNLSDISDLLVAVRYPKVSGMLRVVGDNYFERSDGNVRGLICTVEARSFLKLISPSGKKIDSEIFNDNIRTNLGQINRVNKMIYKSAVSEDNANFWYLNNGITMICDSFDYVPTSGPDVNLENVQIVNGAQTSYALFDAHLASPDAVERVRLFLRIYEAKDRRISERVAEATNSQTPIRSRDLASNDDIQLKLEDSLLEMGYFYERKRGQYADKNPNVRIDSMKAGQAILGYYVGLPDKAKTGSDRIFSDMYETIFNDDLTPERVIAAWSLLRYLTDLRKDMERKNVKSERERMTIVCLTYGQYHILDTLNFIARSKGVSADEYDRVIDFVQEAINTVVDHALSLKYFSAYQYFRSQQSRDQIRSRVVGPQQLRLELEETNLKSPQWGL